MTPEQTAANAADVLDEARKSYLDPPAAGALVVIAAGWTRLYEALSTSPPAPKPITVNMSGTTVRSTDPQKIAAELTRAMKTGNETDGVYRERAALVAHLTAVYPSVIVYGADPSAPDWPLLYVNTVCGQMSWHLSPDDLDLFGHVPIHQDGQAPTWDGHTTEEKYERLAALTAMHAAELNDA